MDRENINFWKIKNSFTIRESFEKFETDNERMAVVVNETDHVIGVLSQGDIIRALASGIEMGTKIDKIVRSTYIHLYERDMKKAYDIFVNQKITLLPIINTEGYLVDMITISDIFDYLKQGGSK